MKYLVADDPAADSGTDAIQQQGLTPPLTCHKISQLGGSCSGEEFVGESLQQLWDIPLTEVQSFIPFIKLNLKLSGRMS